MCSATLCLDATLGRRLGPGARNRVPGLVRWVHRHVAVRHHRHIAGGGLRLGVRLLIADGLRVRRGGGLLARFHLLRDRRRQRHFVGIVNRRGSSLLVLGIIRRRRGGWLVVGAVIIRLLVRLHLLAD